MRMAAMTTRDRASLFLDSVVGSSGCSGTVATWDKVDRFVWLSGAPFLLRGRESDEMLGDLECVRDIGRANAWAEGGRESEPPGSTLVSMDIELRRPKESWLS